jgi:hypothetical protein
LWILASSLYEPEIQLQTFASALKKPENSC